MGQLAMQPHYYKFWRELIKPKGFEVERESLTPRYGKFHVRPLERGFGVTLGNSLRRVLLSSMMLGLVARAQHGARARQLAHVKAEERVQLASLPSKNRVRLLCQRLRLPAPICV